eukprot:m.120709 g.120709  ORF g.120709 m.120709 type:complete len:67 (-) comp28826_c0_seq1:2268-2468(-)
MSERVCELQVLASAYATQRPPTVVTGHLCSVKVVSEYGGSVSVATPSVTTALPVTGTTLFGCAWVL